VCIPPRCSENASLSSSGSTLWGRSRLNERSLDAVEVIVTVRFGNSVFRLRLVRIHSLEKLELSLVRIVVGAEAVFVEANTSDETDALLFFATLVAALAAIQKLSLIWVGLRSVSGVCETCITCIPQSSRAQGP
jgi:hypothetical protein